MNKSQKERVVALILIDPLFPNTPSLKRVNEKRVNKNSLCCTHAMTGQPAKLAMSLGF
jgi:hypothetical protein